MCFWAASTQLDIPANYNILTAGQWISWTAAYGLSAFFLLLPGVFGPQDKGVIRGFLTNPGVRAIGLVSYGIYLWHEFWIDKYFDWTGNPRLALSGATLAGFVVFVAGMSVIVATISYYVVERPALRLRRGGLRGYRRSRRHWSRAEDPGDCGVDADADHHPGPQRGGVVAARASTS